MSDRFKFRFWCDDNQEMICHDNMPEYFFEVNITKDGIQVLGEGRDDDIMGMRMEPMDVVIMQSTGLRDKNGVLIFEGDVLFWDGSVLGAVKYEHFEYIVGEGVDARALCASKIDQREIIGNIYQDKELLEQDHDN